MVKSNLLSSLKNSTQGPATVGIWWEWTVQQQWVWVRKLASRGPATVGAGMDTDHECLSFLALDHTPLQPSPLRTPSHVHTPPGLEGAFVMAKWWRSSNKDMHPVVRIDQMSRPNSFDTLSSLTLHACFVGWVNRMLLNGVRLWQPFEVLSWAVMEDDQCPVHAAWAAIRSVWTCTCQGQTAADVLELCLERSRSRPCSVL